MAASLFKPGELRHLVDGYKKAANTMPDATRAAAGSVGMEIKQAWLGIAASHGAKPGGKIARRKWNVGYNVMGGTGATVKVEYRGPIHLLYGKTKQHIIGAKLLGTRSSIRSKSGRIGANAAFGGSNRGVFGKKQVKVNFNQYGSVRQQAMKGTLRTRSGAHALTIGSNLRAYAFHPGTKGEPSAWPESKAAALRIAPAGYGKEIKKELAKSIGTQVGGAVKGML
jgi:hypothetical protein